MEVFIGQPSPLMMCPANRWMFASTNILARDKSAKVDRFDFFEGPRMLTNPYAGTANGTFWELGYFDGSTNPTAEHSPPLDGVAMQVYREGELQGQDDAAAESEDGNNVHSPPDWWERVHGVLEGSETLNTLAEAKELLLAVGDVGVGGELLGTVALTPVTGILAVAGMSVMVWHALELPTRTVGYQGYAYGLVRKCCDMPDPDPNHTWPGDAAVNNDYSNFFEGIGSAKADLERTLFQNRMRLAIAKRGPKAVLNEVWRAVISEDDHLLRSFEPGWPDVNPA